jgi:ubiquinone/menaquinone biosynthesis C-methylase UbiE
MGVWFEERSRAGDSTVSYRLKLLAFFVAVVAFLILLNVAFAAVNTLSQLDRIEAARDQWQRPSDILQALDPRPGDTIVDLGCGSGYFALKLSAPLGKRGRVIAEDVRWLPLVFLRARTILKKKYNISLIHGQPTNPHLPVSAVNAVLILNTYHELSAPHAILTQVSRALVPGGRLIIVDRQPNPANIGITENGEHEIAATSVDSAIRQMGFDVVSQEDHFIDRDPDRETWWLLVARKP